MSFVMFALLHFILGVIMGMMMTQMGAMVMIVTVLLLVLLPVFRRRRLFGAHADAVAVFLRLEVVVVAAAAGVREAPAAARPRVEVPARNHFRTVASDRVQGTRGTSFDRWRKEEKIESSFVLSTKKR